MVELLIENLGNVKRMRLNVSNLTIFYGKNNTNKTWTAHLVHSIASDEVIKRYVIDFIWNKPSDLGLKDKFIKDYLPRANERVNCLAKQKNPVAFFTKEDVSFIKNLTKDYLNFVAKEFSNFISVSKKQVEGLKVSLRWDNEKERQLLRPFNETFNLLVRNGWYEECSKLSLFRECELILFLKAVMQTLLGKPFNLPVERNSLMTFANLISLGERNGLGLIESFATLKDVLSQINEGVKRKRGTRKKASSQKAVNDAFERLNDLCELLHPDRFNYNYPFPIKEFKDFAQRVVSLKAKDEKLNEDLLSLVQKIIGGRIEFSPTGIVYVNDKGTVLPLTASSSMVKSLAGLYAYVAFKAEKNDLLIIDEPENNLCAEAQAKITEFLSVAANKGIKVLATTHSPCVVGHVANLTEKSKGKAFINKNEVSVYLFSDNGEVKRINHQIINVEQIMQSRFCIDVK